MFVRFRDAGRRLQVSLVETHRADGKVRHEHISSLGSIVMPMSVAGRIAFWRSLHERLVRLSNRLGGDNHGKVLGAVHERIPMVTLDEQRALQLENAKLDAEHWSRIRNLHAGTAEDHKRLATTVASTIVNLEGGAEQAAGHAKAAQERVERIERGENVDGGLQDPQTREDMEAYLIKSGWTGEHIRHLYNLAELGMDDVMRLLPVIMKRKDQVERAVVRNAVKLKRLIAEVEAEGLEAEDCSGTDLSEVA